MKNQVEILFQFKKAIASSMNYLRPMAFLSYFLTKNASAL